MNVKFILEFLFLPGIEYITAQTDTYEASFQVSNTKVSEIFAPLGYYAAILDPWKWDRQLVQKRR